MDQLTSSPRQMSLVECLEALEQVRKNEVVVTAMGAAREWMKLSSHPLDWVFVPSSMGQATSLGLGLALARPKKRVVVCNGDGSTLMNLGSLVTITAEAPPNLTLITLDNQVYEVTGSQSTPGSATARRSGTAIDFAALARACGFMSVYTFDQVDRWRQQLQEVIGASGPTFVWIKVEPMSEERGPKSPGPGKERVERFMNALGTGT